MRQFYYKMRQLLQNPSVQPLWSWAIPGKLFNLQGFTFGHHNHLGVMIVFVVDSI